MKTIHRAKYVLVDSHVLLQNTALDITEDGHISDIYSWQDSSCTPEDTVVDWGTAVIMPGLINAHAHLELTLLGDQPIRFHSFTDWLTQLMAGRRSWSREELQSSVKQGISLSLASGTTMVGDIASDRITHSGNHGNPLRQVIFMESIAFSPDRAEENIADLNRALETAEPSDLIKYGISPHAPYSVSGELYRGLSKLAQQRKLLLSTHIAETAAEIQFLQTGTGQFRDFLQSMNIIPSGWTPPGLLPIPYLYSLGVLGPNCLLIHCNYMDRDSIDTVAHSGSSIVYCPRSHAFFGHPQHPVRQLLNAGINIALGTDSLASNTTLSMLDEMRFLSKNRTDLKSEEILQAATFNGAKALKYGSSLGLLKSGYRADMTVLDAPSNMKAHQVPDQILEGAGECIGTIVAGKIAWQKTDIH